MLSSLASSFSQFGNVSVLALLLLGTVIGLGIGLLPGIGAIVAMSLLLPFTFHMSSFEAFALLLSLYAVVTTAGDLTSILIGIPAHPECAAMIIDGYPLAKKGQAGRAMAAAIYSATGGALIGAVVLAISIPIMRPLVLHVGAPELFMLAMVGVLMVGSVSGDSPLKGGVMGGVGLLLAAVGPDSQTGVTRYGFGTQYLVAGIPLVPLAIGLFAVSQLFSLHAGRRRPLGRPTTIQDVGRRTGLRDVTEHWALVVRGSLIGVVTGIAPGLGSALGQWVAYGTAMQTSKNRELFGHGSIEGVIAPGAANNSKEGGSLIPTLAFGVPGSGAMAVLLGAFLILGLQPGPAMLTNHLNITFFMVIVLVVANVLGSALCLLVLRPLVKVTQLRAGILVPIVIFLVFVGSGSDSGQTGDLITMLVTGLLAWVLARNGWPVIPVILGYVLGKSAEPNLFIANGADGWHWIYRPFVIVLALIAVATMVWSVRVRRRQSRTGTGVGPLAGHGRTVTLGSAIVGVVVTALAVIAVIMAQGWPWAARMFPTVVGVATVIFGVGYLIQVGVYYLRRRRSEGGAGTTGAPAGPQAEAVLADALPPAPQPAAAIPYGDGTRFAESAQAVAAETEVSEVTAGVIAEEESADVIKAAPVRAEIGMLLWLVLMFIASYFVGIGIAGLGFAVVYLIVACREKAWVLAPVLAIIAVLFYYVFVHELKIVLPLPYFQFST
jgi:TctA family transporter